jgi:hypothetical protein
VPESKLPRYLNMTQATNVRLTIESTCRKLARELEVDGIDEVAIEHELGMALARAACRRKLDLLEGAGATIERLEAVVAELGGRLEQARIAGGTFADGTHPGNRRRPPTNGHAVARLEAGEVPHPVDCNCGICRS